MNTYTVTNTNDSGEGSLRWAIEQVNAYTGEDTPVITFAAALAGRTIALASELSLTRKARIINLFENPVAMTGSSLNIEGELQFERAKIDDGMSITINADAIANFVNLNLKGNLYVEEEASVSIDGLDLRGSVQTANKAQLGIKMLTLRDNACINGSGITISDKIVLNNWGGDFNSFLANLDGSVFENLNYITVHHVGKELTICAPPEGLGYYKMVFSEHESIWTVPISEIKAQVTLQHGAILHIAHGRNGWGDAQITYLYGNLVCEEGSRLEVGETSGGLRIKTNGYLCMDGAVLDGTVHLQNGGRMSVHNCTFTKRAVLELSSWAGNSTDLWNNWTNCNFEPNSYVKVTSFVGDATLSALPEGVEYYQLNNVIVSSGQALRIEEGARVAGNITVESGGVLHMNKAQIDGTIYLQPGARLEGDGNTFTSNNFINLSNWSGDTAELWSALTNSSFAGSNAYVYITSPNGDTTLSALPEGISKYLLGSVRVSSGQTLCIEEGVRVKGDITVESGGVLHMNKAQIDGTIYLQPGARLEGDGNTFTSNNPINPSNWSGDTAELWSTLTNSSFAGSNTYVYINSLNGDTTLSALPEGISKYSLSSVRVSSGQTLRIEEGVRVSGNITVESSGVLHMNKAQIDGTIYLQPGARLEGDGNTFTSNNFINLSNWSGDTAELWSALTNSSFAGSDAYVYISSLDGDTTLSALPEGVEYRFASSLAAGRVLTVMEAVTIDLQGTTISGTLEGETGSILKGNVSVASGGVLKLNDTRVEGMIALVPGARLEGEGNIFSGWDPIYLSNWSGNTAEVFASLSNSTFEAEQAVVSIGSLSGDTTLNVLPEGLEYRLGSSLAAGRVLTVQDGVTLDLQRTTISGTLECEPGSTLKGDVSVASGGVLRLNDTRVEGTITLAPGARLEGDGNIFSSQNPLRLSNWSGDTAELWGSLTNSTFEAANASITLQSINGDVLLSALPEGLSVFEVGFSALPEGTTLTLAQGVSLRQTNYNMLTIGGSLICRGQNLISLPREPYFTWRVAATGKLDLTDSTINGTVEVESGGEIGGENVSFGAQRALVLHLNNWNGETPAIFDALSGCSAVEGAYVAYRIDGLAGNTVHWNEELMKKLAPEGFGSPVAENVNLADEDRLILDAGTIWTGGRIDIGAGATLQCEEGCSLKVKQLMYSDDDAVRIQNGGTLVAQGTQIACSLFVSPGSVVQGTLRFTENGSLRLENWSGTTANLWESVLADATCSFAGTPYVELSGYSYGGSSPFVGDTFLAALPDELGSYRCSNYLDIRGYAITLGEGARLELAGYAPLYLASLFECREGSVIGRAGAEGSPRVEVGNGGILRAGGATRIEVNVELTSGSLEGNGFIFAARNALTLSLTSGLNPEAWSNPLEGVGYTVERDDAYVTYRTGTPDVREQIDIDNAVLSSITPDGFTRCVFANLSVAGKQTMTLREGTELAVSHALVVSEDGKLVCEQGTVLQAVVDENTGGMVQGGSQFYFQSEYPICFVAGSLLANDTLFNVTLGIGDNAQLSGDNYELAAREALSFHFREWDGASDSLKKKLEGITYHVSAENAVCSLVVDDVSEDLILDNDTLLALLPEGTASLHFNNLSVMSEHQVVVAQGTNLSADMIHARMGGSLVIEQGVVLSSLHEDPLYLSVGDGSLSMDSVDLNGAEISISDGSLTMTNCRGKGAISLYGKGDKISIRNCDLSQITVSLASYGMSNDAVYDLSGNYWGTTDRDEIISRIENYDASRIVINEILELAPGEESGAFTLSSAMGKDNRLRLQDTSLTVTFNRSIDAGSVDTASVRMLDAHGGEVALKRISCEGSQMTLEFDPLPEGTYHLALSDEIRDTRGKSFVPSHEIYYTCDAAEGVKVLLLDCRNTVTDRFHYFDVYFDQPMDAESINAASVHLRDEQGIEQKISRIVQSKSAGRTFYRVYLETISGKGNFVISLDSTIRSESGSILTGGYHHSLYVAAPNLETTSVACERSEIGKLATITWNVSNIGDSFERCSWLDTVYLSKSPVWDITKSTVLGRVAHVNEAVTQNGSYQGKIDLTWDGFAPGEYYIYVVANESETLGESERDNNLSPAFRVDLSVPKLNFDEHDIAKTNSANGKICYYFIATETGSCRIGIDRECLDISAARGILPTEDTSIGRYVHDREDQYLLLDVVAGETYYVTITPGRVGSLTTTLVNAEFSLMNVSTGYVLPGITSTFTVFGTNFTGQTRFYLKDGQGHVYEPSSYRIADSLHAEVSVEIPEGLPEETQFTLFAVDPALDEPLAYGKELGVFLPNADANSVSVSFLQGMQGYHYASRVGYAWKTELTVQNKQGYDVKSPIILITDTAPDFALYYSYGDAQARDRSALLLLAGNQDESKGVLTASETEKMGIYVKNYRASEGHIGATILDPNDTEAISEAQWDMFGSALRPANAKDWSAWWEDMKPRIGTTVADFVNFVYGMQEHVQSNGMTISGSSLADLTGMVMKSSEPYIPSQVVSGTILDGAGNPVKDLLVEINRIVDGERIRIGFALTDEKGAYVIGGLKQGETYELTSTKAFMHEGRKVNSVEFNLGGGDRTMDLQAPETASSVRLTLRGLTEEQEDQAVAYLKSANGEIVVLQMEAGMWAAEQVETGDYTLHVSVDGCREVEQNVNVGSASANVFEIEPTRLSTLNGRIFHADGVTGLEGVTVALMQGDSVVALARTDASGAYFFSQVDEGTYIMKTLDTDLTLHADIAVMAGGFTVELPSANIDQGHLVTGSLTGAREGMAVILREQNGLTYSAVLQKDGRFSMESIPAGSYRLFVDGIEVDPSYRLDCGAGEEAIDVGSFSWVNCARIEGALSDLGMGVEGYVDLYLDGQLVGTAATDTQGRFGFSILKEGAYTLAARASHGGTAAAVEVLIDSMEQSESVDCVLGHGSFMIANLNDLMSTDDVAMNLYLVGEKGDTFVNQANSFAQAAGVWSQLAEGTYRLEITVGNRHASTEFEVKDGERSYVAVPELQAYGNVMLEISGLNGVSAEGARVYLYDAATHEQMDVGLSDGEGKVALSGLADGEYEMVVFSADGTAAAKGSLNVISGETTTRLVQLQPMSDSLSGTVSGVGSDVMKETLAVLRDEQGVVVGITMVGSDGTYEVHYLVPPIGGSLTVYNPSSGQSGSFDIPAAGELPNVELPEPAAPEQIADPLPKPEPEETPNPDEPEKPVEIFAPTGLSQAIDKDSQSVLLSWADPGNPAGTTYEVLYAYRDSRGGIWSSPVSVQAGTATSTQLQVNDNSLYAWKVVAHGPEEAGAMPPRSLNSDFTVDLTLPSAPSQLISDVRSTDADGVKNDAVLSWSPSQDSSGVKGYWVACGSSPDGSALTPTFIEGTSVQVKDLQDGYHYWWVRAEDENGNLGEWASQQFSVDTTDPSIVSGIRTQVTLDNVFVQWNRAEDKFGISYYELKATNTYNGMKYSSIIDGSATSSLLTAYTPGTYQLQIRAVDTAGNIGDWSNIKGFVVDKKYDPDSNSRIADRLLEAKIQIYTILQNSLVKNDISTRCCNNKEFKRAITEQNQAWEEAGIKYSEAVLAHEKLKTSAVLTGLSLLALLPVGGVVGLGLRVAPILFPLGVFIQQLKDKLESCTTVGGGLDKDNWTETIIQFVSINSSTLGTGSQIKFDIECLKGVQDHLSVIYSYSKTYANQPIELFNRIKPHWKSIERITKESPHVKDIIESSGLLKYKYAPIVPDKELSAALRSLNTTTVLLGIFDKICVILGAFMYSKEKLALNESLENMDFAISESENSIGLALAERQNLLDCIASKGPNCTPPDPNATLPHKTFQSFDPNDIYGPKGIGKENWVANKEMAFQVECENIAKDNIAHAAMVTITQQLDAAFDWSTFRLGDMMLGGNYIEVPDGLRHYKARLDWTETHGILVDAEAGIDLDTGLVTWNFVAIDPETFMVISDPFSGLLAPNYESPEGEGLFNYYVTPKATAVSGTEMTAKADIIFDFNDPIETPTLHYTLDSDAPEATVVKAEARENGRYLWVGWQGDDVGSGVRSFDVYVSTDGGDWMLWQSGIEETQALFATTAGTHAYDFLVTARDLAGNEEALPEQWLPELSAEQSYAAPSLAVEDVRMTLVNGSELTIRIVFNVTVSPTSSWQDVLLVASSSGELDLSEGSFAYDDTTRTLSWTGSAPQLEEGEELHVSLKNGSVQDAEGRPLATEAGLTVAEGLSLGKMAAAQAAPAFYDYNGDGLLDLLLGEIADGKGRVRIYLNEGTAEMASYVSFAYAALEDGSPLTLEAEGCQGAIVRMGDLTGDGVDEMVVGLADGTVRVYRATGSGWADAGFLTCSDHGVAAAVKVDSRAAIEFADMNGDGKVDLLVGAGNGQIALYYNTGTDGTSVFDGGRYLHDAHGLLDIGSRASVATADIDGDGLLDLLVGSTNGAISCYRNYGTADTPLFAEATEVFVGHAALNLGNLTERARIDAADINGDGVLDLAVGMSDGTVQVFLGSGSVTEIAAGQVDTAVHVGTPGHLFASSSGSQVSFSWDAVEEEGVTYALRYRLAGTQDYTIVDCDSNNLTLELPDGLYTWSVQAVTQGGSGFWASSATLRLDTLAPISPESSRPVVNGNAVTLAWSEVEDVSGVQYEVRYRMTGEEEDTVVTVSANRLTLPAMAEGTYVWAVRALDGAGNAAPWAEGESFTIDVSAPEVPKESLTVRANETAARLSWAAVDDPAGLAGYRVQYGTNADFSGAQSLQVSGAELTVFDLAGNATYYWRVASVDKLGNVSGWQQGNAFSTTIAVNDNTAASATTWSLAQDGAGQVSQWVGFGDKVDYFKITPERSGSYTLQVAGKGVPATDSYLYVSFGQLDEKGQFTLLDMLAVGPNAPLSALDGLAMEAGKEYYVRVEAFDKGAGAYNTDYTLSLKGTFAPESVADDTPADARELTLDGETDIASPGVTDWVGYGDATDFYAFSLDESATLHLGLDGLDTPARVDVFRQNAAGGLTQVMAASARPSGLDRELALSSGAYFVQVSSYDQGAGRYNTAYQLDLELEKDGERKQYALASR